MPLSQVPFSQVLGVVDLQAGQAVHAVAGQRGAYQPHIESLTASADPQRLVALYQARGIAGIYVADLDALQGAPFQDALVWKLLSFGLPMWLDAGIRSVADWRQKMTQLTDVSGGLDERVCNVRWIFATESFAGIADARSTKWVEEVQASSHLTIGIDLRGGYVRQPESSDQTLEDDVLPLAQALYAAGVRSFLPLEITSVGTRQGPATVEQCGRLRAAMPDVELVSGGGVRDATDLRMLLDAGCDFVLAATWLTHPTSD